MGFRTIREGSQRYEVVLLVFIPTFDMLSDLVTLLQAKFYNTEIFYCCVAFFWFSNVSFLRHIFQKRWVPMLPWRFIDVGMSVIHCIFHPHGCHFLVDAVMKGLYWASLVFAVPALLFVYFVYIALTLSAGCLLFQSKVIAVKSVQHYWLWFWNKDLAAPTEKEGELEVDCEILAVSLMSEFAMETAPQLILQVANQILMEKLSVVGMFSIGFSALMLLRVFVMFYNRVVNLNYSMTDFIDAKLRTTSTKLKESLAVKTESNDHYQREFNVAREQRPYRLSEKYERELPEVRLYYLLKASVFDGSMNRFMTAHRIANPEMMLTCKIEVLNGMIKVYRESLLAEPEPEPEPGSEEQDIARRNVNRQGNTKEIRKLLRLVLNKRPEWEFIAPEVNRE